ncbi:hypothetical protein BCT04_02460 [Vibrio breoganii]|nr:hypothetical protein BCT04_02460 [Vibrio breoganii]
MFEIMLLLQFVLLVAIIVGLVMARYAHKRISKLQGELEQLQLQVALQNVEKHNVEKHNVERRDQEPEVAVQDAQSPNLARATPTLALYQPKSEPQSKSAPSWEAGQIKFKQWLEHLSSNSLLWLGGFVLALGGVFLAKYAVEAGLISAHARVALGFAFGIALLIGAEYLVRYPKRFNIQTNQVSAALASAGVITCFAMIVVSTHYYQFISSTPALILTIIVTSLATFMALRFGPIVAFIGVIGSYAIPALFWELQPNTLQLALFVVFISASAVYISEKVASEWLWRLCFAGNFAWLLITTLISSSSFEIYVLLSFSLLSLYLFTLVPVLGWRLKQQNTVAMPLKVLLMPRKEQAGLICSLAPLIAFYILYGFQAELITCTLIYAAVLCAASVRHSAFDTWPMLALALAIMTLVLHVPTSDFSDMLFMYTGAHQFTQFCAIAFLMFAAMMHRRYPNRPAFSLLFASATPLLFATSYSLTSTEASQMLYSLWSVELVILAIVAVLITKRYQEPHILVSGWLLANANLCLIFTMLLEAGTLTVALTVQLLALAFWSRRFNFSAPDWLIKVMVAVVIIRLTLAPWLPEYQSETILGIHWTLIIYPVCFALLFATSTQLQRSSIEPWLAGSRLHLIALFVTTETSYFLVGDYPSVFALTFKESALLAMNWLALSLIYLYRLRVSTGNTKLVYQYFACALIGGSALLHVHLFTTLNPLFTNQFLGGYFLLNWLLPLWVIPGCILAIGWLFKLIPTQFSVYALAASGVFIALGINALIRHYFHDGSIGVVLGIKELELYTYSVVWLLLSVVAIVWSQKQVNQLAHHIGFGILFIVIFKAFVIDMSQLTGLYRALSFLGLGLCLVVIGWLFQRLKHDDSSMSKGMSKPT